MGESIVRLTKAGKPPNDSEISKWIGKDAHKYWRKLTQLIEKYFPNAFIPEWLFGGKKQGWSLRAAEKIKYPKFHPLFRPYSFDLKSKNPRNKNHYSCGVSISDRTTLT